MNIAIIGGGSVGLLLAARLCLAGSKVQVITRTRQQADELTKHGLLLHSLQGEQKRIHIQAVSMEGDLPKADLYVLAVKQTSLTEVLPVLRKIDPSARVLAVQNGMGHDDHLKEVLALNQIYFGVHAEGARRHSYTEVEHTGRGIWQVGSIIGQAQESLPVDPVIEAFLSVGEVAGLTIKYVFDIHGVMWRKLMANAVINPLTTLFEIPNGALLESSDTVTLMKRLFVEAKEVASLHGQKIDESTWQEIVQICRNTSRNYSSMLQDLLNCRPLEIEAINGYIVKQGRERNIATPHQEAVYKATLLKAGLMAQRG
ncbi:2-dehydropantoate 2-reductase [Brevibacillus laterosporus]|uniref:2-dehydropantoate 2-reductase n=1 Tax=Brevibacillus laterosporus TaxID=1465 RepID=A0AAP8U578_BRELA|nr:2-dehydropantoate 2-reductase [Brevibacillus laterosporus]ATO48147.1 2-dehydropantoate 2-reductase [Brevibacillus laterosporus DSM 25]MBG9801810.1 2-dehydropantoate 2-reductase [Brevibacillus laterosporus]MED2003791.1 2-dehydropantoate 2-reductase [Brevibacillus laterosporus]MED4762545.1 2-dehydropantoate 2-reductase [Brevibacillus laterosporus]NKQ20804.1 2-dehydropantoate 2-reductase [Brevibacillus laterosporus]